MYEHRKDKNCTKLEKIRQKIEIRKYPIQEVLVGDQTGLSSQGDHARLNTHCLALSSVEVVCAPEELTADHLVYLDESQTWQVLRS